MLFPFFLAQIGLHLLESHFQELETKDSHVPVYENNKETCVWRSLMEKDLIPQGMAHGWLFLNRQDAEGYFTSPTETG